MRSHLPIPEFDMRNILIAGWLILPIAAWAYHEGPGQDGQAMDQADAVLVAAHEAADGGEFKLAVAKYQEALGLLPKELETPLLRTTENRIKLELNKARMLASGLPDAREDLEVLVEGMMAEPESDPALLAEARQALARAQFYTTWLMRLEGQTREVWEPEIEAARQNYRLLAESTTDAAKKEEHAGDLEAAIRLERLAIEDLQGLPLPSE
ncbi:MAG: hypothetical protein KDC48_00975 [Planctomycetes bacterium]|nr:hypothetical protein [Planctomycetota bacterium]